MDGGGVPQGIERVSQRGRLDPLSDLFTTFADQLINCRQFFPSYFTQILMDETQLIH